MTKATEQTTKPARKRLDELDFIERIEFGVLFNLEAAIADPKELAVNVMFRALDKLALYGSQAKGT